MRTLQEQPLPVNAGSSKPILLTRALPGWLNETNFLWTLASLAAIVAGLFLLIARPIQVKTWQADQFTTAVDQKSDYQLYPVETDAAGQRFRWTFPSKALFVAPVTTHNSHRIKVIIRARGYSAAGGPVNPTTVSANDVVIGQFTPAAGKAEFQDFSFTFSPDFRDDNLLRLTFDTPAWKPKSDNRQLGVALQSITVDLQEIWSPLEGPSRAWLIWLLPALALLGLFCQVIQGRLSNRGSIWSLAGYISLLSTFAIAAFMGLGLLLLVRLGYNGLLNHNLYWLYGASYFYLALFAGWVGLAGVKIGQAGKRASLWHRLVQRSAGWRAAHPVWLAVITICLFNLSLTTIFITKLVMEFGSIAPIFRYWDGPEYIFIAHGFYDPRDKLLNIVDFGQHSPFYWAAHFPLFPLALMVVQPVVGWLWSPLVVNLLVSTGFAVVFYRLVKDFNYSQHPLWLTLVALVLPVRWLIYHNVGSSEPIFMFFELLSFYFFKKERYWLAGLAGIGAIFSRPPGIFLWFGFMLFLLFEAVVRSWNTNRFSLPGLVKNFNWRAFVPLLLLPLGLLGVFGIYGWRYGDFLAYFKISENVTHIGLLPFPTMLSAFGDSPAIIYTYVLVAAGLVLLWKQGRFDLFWVCLAAFIYTLFLLHSDVLRYSIPFFALAVIIPFDKLLSGRVARWLSIPVLVALLFYSWSQIVRNMAGLDTFDGMRDILQIVLK